MTTLEANNFEDDFPAFPIEEFKHHQVLVFQKNSMQDSVQICQYSELFANLRLEQNFTFLLEPVAQLVTLGEGIISVAVYKV